MAAVVVVVVVVAEAGPAAAAAKGKYPKRSTHMVHSCPKPAELKAGSHYQSVNALSHHCLNTVEICSST